MPRRAQIALDRAHTAHNYAPLPVVIAEAEGAWVTDVEGRRYLDCLAAYSAVNFGHRHPVILEAARRQLDRVTLISRAFYSDQLGTFAAELAALCGKDMVLPMNTGAEAVESGIKVARKWAHDVKGSRNPNIVVAAGNFHGRTTTIISFSDDPDARGGFGPYTPGFRTVPYGDAEAVAAAIDDDTVAVLVEPIQGEAGVLVPPADYLPRLRELCTRAASAADLRRDPVRAGAHRTHLRERPRRGGAGPLPAGQGARRRRRAGLGGGRATPTCSGCCTRASTARPSAATRWPRPSGPAWSGCSQTGEYQAALGRARCASARAAAASWSGTA